MLPSEQQDAMRFRYPEELQVEARAEPQSITSWPTLLAAPAAAALLTAMMLTLTSLPG
jgi:hypothetical protein